MPEVKRRCSPSEGLHKPVIVRRTIAVTVRSASDAPVHEPMDCHGLQARNDGPIVLGLTQAAAHNPQR